MAAGRASATSRQVASRFLCDDCEQRFSERGERYVLGQCARPGDEFRLRELFERQTPIAREQGVRLYEVGDLLGAHADEYLYFATSVFWRASARAWAEDGPRERFSLGSSYDEQFRLYLLGKADFPRNGRLFVHVWSETIRDGSPIGFTTIAPCTSRIDGERRHKFCIPGIYVRSVLGRPGSCTTRQRRAQQRAGKVHVAEPVRERLSVPRCRHVGKLAEDPTPKAGG